MRTVTFVTLIAFAILVIASQARAGSNCCCTVSCPVAAPVVAPVVVYQPYEPPQIYIVNQGPVYAGGWVYSQPQVVPPRAIAEYPYVASDYPYYYMQPLPRRTSRQPIRARY